MLDGDACERRKGGRLPKHPLGQVRLQAQAFPLACAERAALVPDRVRHAEPAEVVDQPGPSQQPHLVLG